MIQMNTWHIFGAYTSLQADWSSIWNFGCFKRIPLFKFHRPDFCSLLGRRNYFEDE
jgi:hypothetical protein